MWFLVDLLVGRLLRIGPRVRKVGYMLVAETAPLTKALTLGLKQRKVMLDPRQRVIRVITRRGWFFQAIRRIPFDVVCAILYLYEDVAPVAGWTWAHQEMDLFTVKAQLRTGEHLEMARFLGEGDWVNNGIWPDWMYWEEQLEANLTRGNQESESRAFAEVVSQLIGVPVESAPVAYVPVRPAGW